jgi:hypothetical protein
MRVYYYILESGNQFDVIRSITDEDHQYEDVIVRRKSRASAEQYIWNFFNMLRIGSYVSIDKKVYKVDFLGPDCMGVEIATD